MLKHLFIQHYAIIDEISIDFNKQLNIITGETGAGKSIIAGALSLVLGGRADTSVLQAEKKCIIEAVFAGVQPDVQLFLQNNELDIATDITLRREIAVNGKSRMFINDSLVTLSQMRELSILLIDLHQQFDTLELSSETFQRNVMDALASVKSELKALSVLYNKYETALQLLRQLRQQQEDAHKEQDYHRFLYDELQELALQENELENLEAEFKLLSNAEQVKLQLTVLSQQLTDGEHPIVQQLKSVLQKLGTMSDYVGVKELYERLKTVLPELQDIAHEIAGLEQRVSADGERMQMVSDRISLGYKLLKKHNVSTTADLLLIQARLQHKLNEISDLTHQIEEAEKQTSHLYTEALQLAAQISAERKKQVLPFTKKVNALLKQVGMPNACIKVEISESALNRYGIDEVKFLFNANTTNAASGAGDCFEPVHKVASGGELSRLMLSIKSLIAGKLALPTLLFDEIDAGISGEAAKQVGNIMKELAKNHQLIAITHQAQIAAKADAHFFVYKFIKADKIVTAVKLLNEEERIMAIAQMLSGEKPTAAALENAREMVCN